jgi:hypothetical protein
MHSLRHPNTRISDAWQITQSKLSMLGDLGLTFFVKSVCCSCCLAYFGRVTVHKNWLPVVARGAISYITSTPGFCHKTISYRNTQPWCWLGQQKLDENENTNESEKKKNTKKRERFRNLTRKEEENKRENKKENFKRVIVFKALEIIISQFQS